MRNAATCSLVDDDHQEVKYCGLKMSQNALLKLNWGLTQFYHETSHL